MSARRSAVILPGVFLLCVSVSSAITGLPVWIPVFYVGVSLLTYIVYVIDKSAAVNGERRTPEVTLHALALAGGWPGALVARQRLRHKTRKMPFRLFFYVTVMLNCAALLWLHSPGGRALLRALFG